MLTERELDQLRLALAECRPQCANEAAIAAAGARVKSVARDDDDNERANAA